MRKFSKTLVGTALAVGVLVPSGAAVAARASGPAPAPQAAGDLLRDRDMLQTHDRDVLQTKDKDMVRLHDGSTYLALGYQHKSGDQDGTGPRDARPLDGTGIKWGTLV